MKEYKISVIVPVFNAEGRLKPLVENLFSQNGADEVEFIFIDDQSTDESALILEHTIGGYNNAHLLQTEKNCGPAACRNVGLDHASGEYICFVDNDDMLGEPFGFVDRIFSYLPEMKGRFFENMLPMLGKSDIILCRRVMIDPKTGKVSHCHSSTDYGLIDCKLSASYQRVLYMHGMQYFTGSLFRREMILKHKIRFVPGTEPNEDAFFGLLAAYYAESMTTSNNSVYGYYLWPDSLSRHKGKIEHFYQMLLHSNRRLPMLLSHLLLRDEKYSELCRFVHGFFHTIVHNEGDMYNQGIDINRYSAHDAFPEMCMTCNHINTVSTGSAPCPNTTDFKRFIKDTAARFMPEGFDLQAI